MHVLIEALPQILERHPAASVLIVGGEHPTEPDYPTALRDALPRRVTRHRSRCLMLDFFVKYPRLGRLLDLLLPLLATLAALGVGAIMLLLLGANPITAYVALLNGAEYS